MSKLKHVKIIVPVLSIGNVEGTIKALADIADYGSACCHIDSIEAEITVQPGFSAEFAVELQKRIARLNGLSQ